MPKRENWQDRFVSSYASTHAWETAPKFGICVADAREARLLAALHFGLIALTNHP